MICVSLLTAPSAATPDGSAEQRGADAPTGAPGSTAGTPVQEGDEEVESTQRFDGKTESNNDNITEQAEIQEDFKFSCPLCSEKFPSQEALESHAMSVHSVNAEGLQRLQSLINGSHWLNKKDQGMYILKFVKFLLLQISIICYFL